VPELVEVLNDTVPLVTGWPSFVMVAAPTPFTQDALFAMSQTGNTFGVTLTLIEISC